MFSTLIFVFELSFDLCRVDYPYFFNSQSFADKDTKYLYYSCKNVIIINWINYCYSNVNIGENNSITTDSKVTEFR